MFTQLKNRRVSPVKERIAALKRLRGMGEKLEPESWSAIYERVRSDIKTAYGYFSDCKNIKSMRISLPFGLVSTKKYSYVGINNPIQKATYYIRVDKDYMLKTSIQLNVGKLIVDGETLKLPKNFKFNILKNKDLLLEMTLIPEKITDEILKKFVDTCQNIKILNCE